MPPEVSGAPDRAPVRAVIFDLDGTLVQTRVASWEVFSQISDRFGLGVDDPEQYFDLFRGNVFASIEKLCRDTSHAAEVKEAFLALLRDEYTPPMVPGMVDVVRRLADDATLAVMSSNAMAVLRRVLVTNELAFCFAHVFGGDVAPDKRTAIKAFLADSGSGFGRRCAADYDEAGERHDPGPASTVLVTDTAGDVRDALEAGIRVVGVAWGMHSVDELAEAGAEFVALWPQEVSAYLLGPDAARPPLGACALPARGVGDSGGGDRGGDGGGDADCGCGCSSEDDGAAAGRRVPDTAPAAAVRRARRQDAARVLAGASRPATREPGDELLAAVRRVCRGG